MGAMPRGRHSALKAQESDCNIKCPMYEKCSGEWREKGCDGTGKIQGGIATIGFMSWWPIKVFRPCPAYLEAGYVYKREGQTMDQVLFSEPSTKMKEKMEQMRVEEAKNIIKEQESSLDRENNAGSNIVSGDISDDNDGNEPSVPENSVTDEEQKFLEDRFGKQ